MKSEMAKARDRWLQGDEGKKCCRDSATGQFLQNRLKAAFIAGWGFGYKARLEKATEIMKEGFDQVLKDKGGSQNGN